MLPRSRIQWLALVFAVVFAWVGSAACDRNTEPYVPGEPARQPDLSRIFPERDAAPLMPEPPGEGGVPATELLATGSVAGATIRGVVELGPGIDAPAGAILFISARSGGATAGPPVAALRVPGPQFPQAFEIGQANVMLQGTRFEGELRLSARLDSDGNVMTRLPGDLSGGHEAMLAPGAEGIVIVLDQTL